MNSSLIGKVQKAHQYAQEPDRVKIGTLTAQVQGDNGTHNVRYENGAWECDCHFFVGWAICCHTMGVELLMGPMIPTKQPYPVAPVFPAITGSEAPAAREVVLAH